jgi:hypothetical protein
MEQNDRSLTEEDINAIAEALEKRLENKFYRDLGKGFWGLVTKGLLLLLLFIAAQGAFNGNWWKF